MPIVLADYTVYCVAKAGLTAMTRALAKSWRRTSRQWVAPGAILWPEHDIDSAKKADILTRIPMKRAGEASDIAKAVVFLAANAPYVTGQILAVDGGRSLFS